MIFRKNRAIWDSTRRRITNGRAKRRVLWCWRQPTNKKYSKCTSSIFKLENHSIIKNVLLLRQIQLNISKRGALATASIKSQHIHIRRDLASNTRTSNFPQRGMVEEAITSTFSNNAIWCSVENAIPVSRPNFQVIIKLNCSPFNQTRIGSMGITEQSGSASRKWIIMS